MATNKPTLAALQAKLEAIYRQQSELYNALTDEFSKQLDSILTATLAALMEHLRTSLKLDSHGNIERNPENLLALTRLDTEFQKRVRRQGYKRAINAFVNQFPEQFSLLRDTFAVLSYALDRPNLRQGKLLFASDLKVLHAQQLSTIDVLNDVPAQVGIRVKQKAQQALGGANLADMQQMLHKAFTRGTSDATALYATAMSTFYRVAEARVYDRIDDNPKKPLRFVYSGPDDVLTRPFCHRMLALVRRGKTWTRAELDQLDNAPSGPGPGSVITCGGGWNCRHSVVLALQQ
jgi:hypothetical protein